jgi:5-methylthioadenosine/S-adenosylhomocysteine deaminase
MEDTKALQEVDILVDHAIVLPMTSPQTVIWDGAVAVKGDRIAAVGPSEDVRRRYVAKHTIDATNQLAMPGFVNTHMHLFGAFARGLVNDLAFTKWVQKKFYITSRGLNPDNYYLGAQFSALDMLKSGTTTFLDCGTYQGLEEAAVGGIGASGIRAVLARAMADIDDPLAQFLRRSDKLTEANLEKSREFIERFDMASDGRIRTWVCPIQVTSGSDELFTGAMQLAQKYKVGLVTHSNVDREDIANHDQLFHERPIERFHRLGILNPRFVGTHMGWLSDREIELLEQTGAAAVHCPSASMKGAYGAISHGKFPELLQRGITVGLGTDGPAASCFLDMFRVIHLAATAHKESRLDPRLISPYDALWLATMGSSRCALMDTEVGSLEPAKKADLIILDLMHPEMIPWHTDNLLDNLVYSATGSLVHTVMVDGKILVQAGSVKTMDEHKIAGAMQREAPKFVALSKEWDRQNIETSVGASGK